jgi:hypothetical protein
LKTVSRSQATSFDIKIIPRRNGMTNTNRDLPSDAEIGETAAMIVDTTADSAGQPTVVLDAVAAGIVKDTAEHSIAAFVNPTDYEDYWRTHFYGTMYYVSGCVWKDYRPAYRLGFDAYFSNHGRKFDEVESELSRSWEVIRDQSQLTWSQAKPAVRDGWEFVECAVSRPMSERNLQ